MNRSYLNKWIPRAALEILRDEAGTILDVGGGAAPYARAAHILDIGSFSSERLAANAWPSGNAIPAGRWTEREYTQFDLNDGKRWPFREKQFDLGLCSHCLEDIRDPIPAVKELARVSRRILIVCPSRLAEQTRGVDHPRYCGFRHHPWMIHCEGTRLFFRRKTSLVEFHRAHLVCPFGEVLKPEFGSMFFCGVEVEPVEQVFHSDKEDMDDYVRFIEPFRCRRDIFVRDAGRSTVRHLVWRFRQKYLGAV